MKTYDELITYRTRGYAFVEYLTHRHAALARRKLVPGRNFLFDQEIERVDWAEPEHEVDPDIMARVKVLFIRNLTMDTTQDEILATFEAVSDGQVDRVKKAKGQLISKRTFGVFKSTKTTIKFFEGFLP